MRRVLAEGWGLARRGGSAAVRNLDVTIPLVVLVMATGTLVATIGIAVNALHTAQDTQDIARATRKLSRDQNLLVIESQRNACESVGNPRARQQNAQTRLERDEADTALLVALLVRRLRREGNPLPTFGISLDPRRIRVHAEALRMVPVPNCAELYPLPEDRKEETP